MSDSLVDSLSYGMNESELTKFSVSDLRFSIDSEGRSPLQVTLLADNLVMTRAVLNLAFAKPLAARRSRELSRLRSEAFLATQSDRSIGELGEWKSTPHQREVEVDSLLAPAAESLYLSLLGRPDCQGWTALHYAAQASPGATRLIQSFAPPGKSKKVVSGRASLASARDSTGCSPLHVAAAAGNVEAISSLLRWHAEPHPVNLDGDTPMDVASNGAVRRALGQSVNEDLLCDIPNAQRALNTLLECGESVNQGKGLLQQSVLHRACEVGRPDLVKFLVEKGGADVNQTDSCGWTPLHYCAKHSSRSHRSAAEREWPSTFTFGRCFTWWS